MASCSLRLGYVLFVARGTDVEVGDGLIAADEIRGERGALVFEIGELLRG